MFDLTQAIEGQNFKTKAELKKFMDGIMKGGGVIPFAPTKNAKNAANAAQELIYDAWEAGSKSERIRLAKRALSIYPDCADGYNLLAEDAAKTVEESAQYYTNAMEAGLRALGETKIKEMKGHFWGFLETRPYMRARAGLMQCLWNLGKHDEAIKHAREMLKMNPNDNQGIRYILIAYLAELKLYDELDTFMNKGEYQDDCVAEWAYTRALLSFAKNGASPKAQKELELALRSNVHVTKYLTGQKSIPRLLPDSITIGGEDEAFCYAAVNIKTWKNVPGAIDWLKKTAASKFVLLPGREKKGTVKNY